MPPRARVLASTDLSVGYASAFSKIDRRCRCSATRRVSARPAVGQRCVTERDTGEVGSGEVGSGQLRVGEVGVGEVGADEGVVVQILTGEIGVGEVRLGEVNAGDDGAGEVSAGEIGLVEESVGEDGTDKVGAGEVSAGELVCGEVSAREIGVGEVSAGEVEAVEGGAGKIDAGAARGGLEDAPVDRIRIRGVVDHEGRGPEAAGVGDQGRGDVNGGARKVVGLTRRLRVSWIASDPDHDPLMASVDYSSDGGHTWRHVVQGPSTGHASIPGRYLESSDRGRVRVVVNDGFSDATALSALLNAPGTPPSARIVLPVDGASLQAGPVRLIGAARDDHTHRLRGRALIWFAGSKRLGTGEVLRAQLPAGRIMLRLLARDLRRRTTVVTRRLLVAPVALRLLRLQTPAHVGRRADTVAIGLATSVPATLHVGSHSYRVGPHARTVKTPASSTSQDRDSSAQP